MKKIKILGIITMIFLVLIIAVFAVLALFGILKIETGEDGKTEISFAPLEEKNEFLEWQTSETEGDRTAVIKTEKGEIKIKLSETAAAEKFIELKNSGAFRNAEFSVLAENMFIQSTVPGENFEAEQNEFAAINGAVAFVMEKEKAAPSFVLITAEKLSGNSSAFLKNGAFDSERAGIYEKFGGIPEYEGKILVFGQVVSGMETVLEIAEKENSGYTGGYLAAEPEKIISLEISEPLPDEQ